MARRYRRYLLDMQDLMKVFNGFEHRGPTIGVPVGCGIPETAVVRTVVVDHARLCLGLIVEDESFAEVAECCEIPVVDGCCWIEIRTYRTYEQE